MDNIKSNQSDSENMSKAKPLDDWTLEDIKFIEELYANNKEKVIDFVNNLFRQYNKLHSIRFTTQNLRHNPT